MWVDPDRLFLTSVIIACILVVITAFVWFFLRDQPAMEQRFKWNQYSRDFIRTEYVDRQGQTWIVDVKYRARVILPSCRNDGVRNMTLIIPDEFPVKDFEEFISNTRKVNDTGHKVVRGLLDTKTLSRLHFNTIDLKVFDDFKKTIYQKALNH